MLIESFVNGAYRSQSVNACPEICMNLYPEVMESPGAKATAVLYPCPGFTADQELTPGPIRAMFSQDGRTFIVSGFNFYERNSDGTSTLWGVLSIDGNPATITSNGDGGHQLGITSGDHFYCFDLDSNTLSTVLSSGATMCDFVDSFGLILNATDSILQITDLEDMSVVDPTQFAQRTQYGDKWTTMKVVHGDIILNGSQTGEAWYNAGTSPFPFTPREGASWQMGSAAGFAMCQVSDTLVWLSRNAQGSAMVHRLNGYAPERLSTHAIEFAMQGYANVDDALAFSYQQQGHAFYVLLFPSANATWCYDASTGLWHGRGFWNVDTSAFDCYRVQAFCQTDENDSLVGDRLTGDVYVMSTDTATEVDGTGIRRQRRFPIPTPDQNYYFMTNLQIYGESATALTTGQGSDPQLQMSFSKDGGHTFSNTRWTSMGAVGQYAFRWMWRGIVGRARNPVIDVVCSEPVPLRMIQAFVDIERGTY